MTRGTVIHARTVISSKCSASRNLNIQDTCHCEARSAVAISPLCHFERSREISAIKGTSFLFKGEIATGIIFPRNDTKNDLGAPRLHQHVRIARFSIHVRIYFRKICSYQFAFRLLFRKANI